MAESCKQEIQQRIFKLLSFLSIFNFHLFQQQNKQTHKKKREEKEWKNKLF